MSRQQILEKAIQKAIDGGWKNKYYSIPYKLKMYKRYDMIRAEYKKGADNPDGWLWYDRDVNSIIFNHDFAKALWGGEKAKYYVEYVAGDKVPKWIEEIDGAWVEVCAWQYHLQQMVISEDPIKYLEENL